MPTLNKLEYLDETKQQIKNALNTKFNSQITDNDTFRSYVDKIKNIYNTWSKVTGEGTNISLNNTKKGLMSLVPKGNTEQTTYTGKNIWNVGTLSNKTDGGITFTPVYENNQLKYINMNGTATANVFYQLNKETLPAGTYKINGCTGGSLTTYLLAVNYGGSGRISQVDSELTFTLSEERTATESFIRIENGTTVNNVKVYPMISISGGDYEPYVGGTTSPNPDYPQEIESVTGNQEIKVTGKNLFDAGQSYALPANENYSQAIGEIYLEANNKYYFSYNVDNDSASNTRSTIYLQIGTGTRIYQNAGANNNLTKGRKVWEYTPTESATYNVGYWLHTSNVAVSISNFMISTSSDTTYEPYQSATYELNLGNIELNKIGDYEDRIYKDNGKWYVEKNTRKLELAIADMNNSENYPGWKNLTQLTIDFPNQNTMLKIFTKFMFNIGSENYEGVSVNTIGTGVLYLGRTYWGSDYTQTYWKTNYPDLVVSIIYSLQTPEITEITNTELIEDLDNLASAMSYDGITNISSSGSLPIVINASALMKGGN